MALRVQISFLKGVFGYLFFTSVFICFYLSLSGSLMAKAQNASEFSVASTFEILGENISFGDVVSYSKEDGKYYLSNKAGDEDIFGVIQEESTFIFRNEEVGENDFPIVRSGRVSINVIMEGGSIKAGDYITSASIPGKGKKASNEENYVLGVALNSFRGETDEEGKINVLLDVGLRESGAGGEGGGVGFGILGTDGEGPGKGGEGSKGEKGGTIGLVKYIAAALISLGSLFFAFKNFMTVINEGITSVGRNPLAKSSVWSMVIFNIILSILVILAGVFLSIFVILFT